jgi:hypothetical protein
VRERGIRRVESGIPSISRSSNLYPTSPGNFFFFVFLFFHYLLRSEFDLFPYAGGLNLGFYWVRFLLLSIRSVWLLGKSEFRLLYLVVGIFNCLGRDIFYFIF